MRSAVILQVRDPLSGDLRRRRHEGECAVRRVPNRKNAGLPRGYKMDKSKAYFLK